MIFRKATVGGKSSTKRKAYLRSIHHIKAEKKESRLSLLITFSKEDFEGVCMPYDDLVVVPVVIANFEVQKILVNSGSTTNILFYKTSKE